MNFQYSYADALTLLREIRNAAADLRRCFTHEQGNLFGKWITIGGAAEGGKKHVGGTPVHLDKSGKIDKGPSKLEGKKPDELSKEKKAARAETHFHGDRAEYTGKSENGLHEIEMMEGHEKGQKKWTPKAPGEGPGPSKESVERNRREWRQQQEAYSRLAKAQAKQEARSEAQPLKYNIQKDGQNVGVVKFLNTEKGPRWMLSLYGSDGNDQRFYSRRGPAGGRVRLPRQ